MSDHDSRYYQDEHCILPSHTEEEQSLKLQHKNTKQAFGGRLILASEEEYAAERGIGFWIARLGQILHWRNLQLGAWALDIAASLPPTISDVSIIGFDIETRLFPSPQTLSEFTQSINSPSRNISITFTQQSLLEPFPAEWKDRMGLINQRFLHGSLTKEQWPEVLERLHGVLKPDGGVLQIGEMGQFFPNYGPYLTCFKHIFFTLLDKRSFVSDIVIRLPSLLHCAGFTNIQRHPAQIVYSGDEELERNNRKNLEMFIRGVWNPALQEGIISMEEDGEGGADEFAKKVIEECEQRDGCGIEAVYFTATRREASLTK